MSVHDCRAMQDDDWSYNQPVDGDEIVSMCLVDNDIVDGQLAYAAGGLPSKPHEGMVSNLLIGFYPPTHALSLCKRRMIPEDVGNLSARDS